MNEKLTPHPQADILIAYAKGKEIQGRLLGRKWKTVASPLALVDDSSWELRVKPETININGHEVPAPVLEPLEKGQVYWLVRCCSTVGSESQTWNGDPHDFLWLKNGLIHLHHKAADAHTEALLSFTRRDE